MYIYAKTSQETLQQLAQVAITITWKYFLIKEVQELS